MSLNLKFLQPYLKTVAGFVVAVLTNAATDWTQHGYPIPNSVGDGVRWLCTIAAATILTYRIPNFYTVEQAQQKLDTAKHRKEEGKQPA